MASPSEDQLRQEKGNSLGNLTFEQTKRVVRLLIKELKIPPSEGSYPTLAILPFAIIRLVRRHLDEKGISVAKVQLKGSGASFCLVDDSRSNPALSYNDLDVGFQVKLRGESDLSTIKEEVLNSLLHFFPEVARKDSITSRMLEVAYVIDQAKI